MKNKKGFTLVELLAVIVILGVLLLIAIPSVSNIINNQKEKVFVANALTYLSSAKNLDYNSKDDIIFFELGELSNTNLSPFGGDLEGKVIRIKDDVSQNYNYYILLEDEQGNTLGYDTIGNSLAVSESDLQTTSFQLNKNINYGQTLSSTLLSSNPYISKNTILIYQNNEPIVYSMINNTKVENIQYMPGASVAVKLSDDLDYANATIIKQIDDSTFEVLLDSDFYYWDAVQLSSDGTYEYTTASATGRKAVSTIEIQLKNKINSNFKNKNINVWKNVKNIRPLSTVDINYFANLLGDDGKVECSVSSCKNTISENVYSQIINTFKVGNVNVRRNSSTLKTEIFVADTWLFDENLCIYDQTKTTALTLNSAKCAVIDFSTSKIFLGNNKTVSENKIIYANTKVILTIDKQHISIIE